MNNNISIILSYHDINLVDFPHLYGELTKISHNIYPLDTNYHTSEQLKEFTKKYGHYKGCRFDEFNTQCYFIENIKDNNEYVCTSQYRRYFEDLYRKDIILDEKVIYVTCDNRDILSSIQMIFGDQYNIETISKLINIISISMNISHDDTIKILFYSFPVPISEMYLCKKTVQKLMVDILYRCIDLSFNTFDKSMLNKSRFMGYMIELFMGIYFKKLELFNNYKLYNIKKHTLGYEKNNMYHL